MGKASILASEAAHFGGMAHDWWDPDGDSAMLHKMGPVRLEFIRHQINRHFDADEHDLKPLKGKRALDVGCGAGLLAEPLARLGAEVTGFDAAPELIEAAKGHAAGQRLEIDYRAGELEALDGQFDLVCCLEVIEHVADPAAFVEALEARLAPGGLLIMSTPNRTEWSRLLTITLAEGMGKIPKGTHHYDQFIDPQAMEALLDAAGLEMVEVMGIAAGPMKGLHLSEDLRLNYIFSAVRR